MIDVFEVLDWLNVIDGRSYLDSASRRLSRSARVTSLSDAGVQRRIDRLQEILDASTENLHGAEIALHCAALEYWRGWFSEAARHANQAASFYKDCSDDHRRAVAMWMLGMAQWHVSRNPRAFANWRGARGIFKKRREFFRSYPPEREWYDCCIRKMKVALASKPEEPHAWLNRYRGTDLTGESQQFVGTVQEKIRQQAYPDVYALMDDLQSFNRWTPVTYEKGEAYLECGLASYQIGNFPAAIVLLKKAVREYSPGIGDNHRQMIARWMLGAVEWMASRNDVQAASDWRQCVENLDALKVMADTGNEQDRKKWYADRSAILKEALSEHLPSPRRSPQRCIYKPAPKPQLADEPRTDRYEYLVTLVAHDRAVADRLIEHERAKMPHGSWNDWVERAVEHLLRSRS